MYLKKHIPNFASSNETNNFKKVRHTVTTVKIMRTSKINTKSFDVVFNDDCDSNRKGFNESYEYCLNYIKMYNGTTESYFADYKGGTVSIINNDTEECVYNEIVK